MSHTGFTVRGPGAVRFVLAALVLALSLLDVESPAVADRAPHPAPVVGTPLPSGWEQCIVQGVGAAVTPDDVANLDAWQMAEGGSTDNASAFNPFNTRQAADATGKPLALVADPGGFPAYASWAVGCAATVETLLQPDMAPIVTALKAGDVSPPGMFLSDVDQSPWCAPSADGLPCYASEILSAQLLSAVLGGGTNPVKSTLTDFTGVGVTLHDYEQDVTTTTQDQQELTARTHLLSLAEEAVSQAQQQMGVALSELRRFAVHDYIGDGAVDPDSNLQLFGSSDEQQTIAEYYGDIATYVLALRYDQAKATLAASQAHQQTAQASVTGATATLDAAQSQEQQDYAQLEADVGGIQDASGCASLQTPLTAASPATAAHDDPATPPAGAGSRPSTTTSTTAPSPTTASTTTAPTTTAPTTTTAQPSSATPSTASSPGAATPAAPPGPPPTIGQLWDALQSCLAGSPPPAGSTTGTPTLSHTGGG